MKMPSFEELRRFLELFYFLSNIALAAIAAYGLKQIRILKQDIHIRNERAAKEQAIVASERFIKSVESNSEYIAAVKAAGLSPYSGPIGDFTVGSLSKEAQQMGVRKFVELTKLWLAVLNELEALAAAYVSGIADEQLGYTILGVGFCKSVEGKYDVISLQREKGAPETNYWKNTIALYRIWSERAKNEGLRVQFDDIALKLKASPDLRITPIGMHD